MSCYHEFPAPNKLDEVTEVNTQKCYLFCCNFCGNESKAMHRKGFTAQLLHLKSCKGGGDSCEFSPLLAYKQGMLYKAKKNASPIGIEKITKRHAGHNISHLNVSSSRSASSQSAWGVLKRLLMMKCTSIGQWRRRMEKLIFYNGGMSIKQSCPSCTASLAKFLLFLRHQLLRSGFSALLQDYLESCATTLSQIWSLRFFLFAMQ